MNLLREARRLEAVANRLRRVYYKTVPHYSGCVYWGWSDSCQCDDPPPRVPKRQQCGEPADDGMPCVNVSGHDPNDHWFVPGTADPANTYEAIERRERAAARAALKETEDGHG